MLSLPSQSVRTVLVNKASDDRDVGANAAIAHRTASALAIVLTDWATDARLA